MFLFNNLFLQIMNFLIIKHVYSFYYYYYFVSSRSYVGKICRCYNLYDYAISQSMAINETNNLL